MEFTEELFLEYLDSFLTLTEFIKHRGLKEPMDVILKKYNEYKDRREAVVAYNIREAKKLEIVDAVVQQQVILEKFYADQKELASRNALSWEDILKLVAKKLASRNRINAGK